MIYDIVKYPHPVLRAKTEPCDDLLRPSQDAYESFFETLAAADGVGLAAPQIGLTCSMFVMSFNGKRRVVINPVVLNYSKETFAFTEGCLSIPGLRLEVVRPKKVKVEYTDETGRRQRQQFEGMTGRIFQHEFDHLCGVLFIDRVTPELQEQAKPYLAKLELDFGAQ